MWNERGAAEEWESSAGARAKKIRENSGRAAIFMNNKILQKRGV